MFGRKKQVVTYKKTILRPLQLGKRSICRWLIVCCFFIIFPGAKLVCTSKHSLGIQPRTRFFRTGVTACHHAKARWNSDNEPTLSTKELERERGRDTYIMWLKQCHKLPMTGNGNHTTYKNGDDWGMVYGIVSTTLYIYIILPTGPVCCPSPE